MPLNLDFNDKATLEKYSSAFSLSDMEIFVFPELLYPLVLANIMSPILWEWRDDPWFRDIQKKTFNYKVNRVKQFIMDHFVFNLDLETWGLTKKETEIGRFSDFIDIAMLEKSNALFGYEGDKYYFDIDIRRHFGLDKYNTNVIPYWKTETVEAMTAFKYKENFGQGAGECVSFSALYAAALFVVGRIPLEQIFLIGTPLHSQNFIDVKEGMLTNNRRIVTKNMWFNGTAMSAKARRALENEKVTIVSHISGFIHYVYPQATIDPAVYNQFADRLGSFLKTGISGENFVNFLRYHMSFKKCFQYLHCSGTRKYYLPLETIFEYEHQSKFNFAPGSRDALLEEIEDDEFSLTPFENRIDLLEVEEYLDKNKDKSIAEVRDYFLEKAKNLGCNNENNLRQLFQDLKDFLEIDPRLPEANKEYRTSEALVIKSEFSRTEIIELIHHHSEKNEVALLALYAYRQMDKIDWTPYMKAALDRNPVALEGLQNKSADEAYELITSFPNESVYDGCRLAQPDEVWNFNRGDGVEKAVLMASYIRNYLSVNSLTLEIDGENVILKTETQNYLFHSEKGLKKIVNVSTK